MLRLLFFASCADQSGVKKASCEFCPTPRDILTRARPLLKFAHPDEVRVAVNRAWADWDTPLSDDDEVAFTPPVGGG
jgi:molybdopterin converting factor small subunit